MKVIRSGRFIRSNAYKRPKWIRSLILVLCIFTTLSFVCVILLRSLEYCLRRAFGNGGSSTRSPGPSPNELTADFSSHLLSTATVVRPTTSVLNQTPAYTTHSPQQKATPRHLPEPGP